MENRIARELLIYTLQEISAVVSLDASGNVLLVRMFDTVWMPERMRVARDARQVLLICNHPGGGMEPTDKERENFARLKARAKGAAVRLFLCSEYDAVREIMI